MSSDDKVVRIVEIELCPDSPTHEPAPAWAVFHLGKRAWLCFTLDGGFEWGRDPYTRLVFDEYEEAEDHLECAREWIRAHS